MHAQESPDPFEPLLAARRLTRSYGRRKVLDSVDLTIGSGERVALMGPSGSGKTTLLNCLSGLDRFDSGSIRVLGRELADLNEEKLAALRLHHLGSIFQFFHLLPTLTAFENVELPLMLLNRSPEQRRQRARELLARVGVDHRAGARPAQLSGGEMQRVAIARALAPEPAILLADEPTGNLDSQAGEAVLGLLREVSGEAGAALLLITHSREAASICERQLRIRDGRIEHPGTPVAERSPTAAGTSVHAPRS